AGWRMEIKRYPVLTEQAAWRTAQRWETWWNDGQRRYATQQTGFGGYYTQEELRQLVAYAAERGVTIIPEIEFPAHSEEVTAVLPHLACTGTPYTSADFCIGSDSTYLFMADVLHEVCEVFPSPFIHLGGDEAGGKHWKTCPRCKGLTQTDAMRRVNEIVRSLGRRMICWDEVLTDEPLDTSIVIMVWRDPATAQRARQRGHEVIYAPGRYCYLDKYQDQPSTQPRAMGGYLPVDSIYRHLRSMAEKGGHSLGLCLWTEYVPTEQAAWRTAQRWETWWNDGQRRYANKQTGFGGYYTQEELRHLVAYAAERGVTIIPEIEFPAHSEEVTAVLPHLACTGTPYTSADFCIGSDSTYLFMADVLREVCEVFPSPFIHLGGDEAGGKHWKTCPRCKGLTQTDAMRRVNAIVRSLGRRMICWDEVLTDQPLDTSIVIMVWRDPATAQRARQRGHEVIYAPGRYCYLDKYQDQPSTQPRAMGGYLPVDSIYRHLRPLAMAGGQSLGLCLWTEYVPTEQDAERMLWPRALALAEALKEHPRSPKAFRRWAERETRALRQRGINAYDISREAGQRPAYLKRVNNLATGHPVTYLRRYHDYYPAAGDASLTDGLQGGWSNTDGRWQGFLGALDIVIDLERVRPVKELQVSFFQSTGVEIYLPSSVEMSVSTDSLTWISVATTMQAPEPRTDLIHTYRLPLSPATEARYVRLKAQPDSHGGWLFCDEVILH
nr:family 20 glycosylhydrolase [Bacteroidaceae bacterium]